MLQTDSCANVAAEKEISGEKLARQQSIGRKYSVKLDKSVSSDLQKLRDRLAAAKAELSAIRADVVSVTSPVRRSPPEPSRAAAAPPKTKQTTTKPVPPVKPPVYTLRRPPALRQPQVVSTIGPVKAGAVAAGRKAGVGARQQKTKVEEILPKAVVGKPPMKPGPVRPVQQKKPAGTTQQPQTQAARRVTQPPAAPKQMATRRPADTVERQKATRGPHPDTTSSKREVKKRQTTVPPQSKVRGDGPFPVDVDKQYTMKKFIAQRESDLSTSIVTIPDQPLHSLDHMVREVAKDVAHDLDDDKQLYQASTDETCDQLQSSWLEFPNNTDQLQQLNNDIKFDSTLQSLNPTPEPSDVDVKEPVDEEKVKDYVGNIVASAHEMVAEHEHGTGDEMTSVSAAKPTAFGMAMSSHKEKQTNKITKTEEDAEELLSDVKTGNEEMQLMQSSKPLIEEMQSVEREADKTKLEEVTKDEDGQSVYYSTDDDAETKTRNTRHKEDEWRKSAKDEDRQSSASVYDDHQTLPDDDLDYNDEIRMLDQRMTSSTAVPMSRLSYADVMSAGSSASDRNIVSPDLQPRSSEKSLETIQPTGAQETGTWKQSEVAGSEKELVIVIDKESKAEIVMEYKEKDMDDQKTTEHLSDDEPVNPMHDNDEAEVYWSGADNEEEDELQDLEESFDEDTDDVAPGITHTRDLSEMTAKTPYPQEEREWEPGVTASAEVDDGRKMIEPPGGGVTSHEVAKVTVVDGLVAGETVTKETAERVSINAGLTETAAERGNDFVSDGDYITAAIGGTSNYLEEEYGLPVLTSLDTEEDREDGMRGEGSPMKAEDAERLSYALGDDGLPNFGAEYTLGITTEDGEETATTIGGQEQLVSKQENSAIGGKQSKRLDDEVSLLPEASQSELWDDALYHLSNPSSPVQPQESEEFAEDGWMESEQDVEKEKTTTTVEVMDPDSSEDAAYTALPVLADA